MPATVVIGTQWGDEGKGKVVDFLARDADIVVRSQGGNNAGHTVVIGDEIYKLYHLPCGVLHPEKISILGSGMVIDPGKIIGEIQGLHARGIPTPNILISHRAHLIMPWHTLIDELEENRRTDRDSRGKIGTTKRGIGPAFADKMSRTGLRMCDLLNPDDFREHVRYTCEEKNALIQNLYKSEPLDPNKIAEQYLEYGEFLKEYIGDGITAVVNGLNSGKHILFEGAQGTLLDIDYGIVYPFLTSSHPGSSGAVLGTGLAPNKIDRIVGVVKAYISRVGEGPFPTELNDELGEKIRDRGNEYGTTTGRPRRVGWLDLALLNYSSRINGLTEMVITKVDVLDDLPEIQVAVGYKLNGETIKLPPSNPADLIKLEPIYETLPGWLTETSHLESGDTLPPALENYIHFISKFTDVPVKLLGVGTRRSQMVEL